MVVLLTLATVVFLMIIAASKWKFHPFLSLLTAAVIMGFSAGLTARDITDTIASGFGKTLGSIGIIIAFGTIIGTYLEKSGGARSLAHWVLKVIGAKRSLLAMNLTGFIVSIPVYCDSGFIILSSLNKAISKTSKLSIAVLGVALAAGLYATHVFVPPTPGPLAAAAALDADLGTVMLLGLLVAVPVALSGYLWARILSKKESKGSVSTEENSKDMEPVTRIKTAKAILPILIPILLIALNSIANYPTAPFGAGKLQSGLTFIGHPIIALFIGVVLAFRLKTRAKEVSHFDWVSKGLTEAGIIILITGAGGAFGAILQASGIGDIICTQF